MATTIDGTSGVTAPSGAIFNGIASGTSVASTSGTSIDFTGIPSWVKRITVMFSGVSTSGTSSKLIQLGTGSTTFTTSGYVSTGTILTNGLAISSVSQTAGFHLYDNAATDEISGQFVITNVTGNLWVASYSASLNTTSTGVGGGRVSLGSTLTAVRITTVGSPPTDTFDAGSINILYE